MTDCVDFANLNLGDRVSFLTANNGFGEAGTPFERIGTVLTKTDATIVIACESNLIGDTARLTRRAWSERSVRRIEKAAKQPYRAESVQIVDMGHTVWALYIPDPEQANDPQHVADNLLRPEYRDVEVLATMRRFYKKDGANFSGWIVEGPDGGYSDDISHKRQAMSGLRYAIAAYFAPRKNPQPMTEQEPKLTEFGVFNDEGCVFVADTKAEAEAQADVHRAEDDGYWAELYSVREMCPDHRDLEQSKDDCQECHNE